MDFQQYFVISLPSGFASAFELGAEGQEEREKETWNIFFTEFSCAFEIVLHLALYLVHLVTSTWGAGVYRSEPPH